MGVEYEMLNPEIDEKAIRDKDAEKLVLALAHAKADALLKREEVKQTTEGTTLLVTCDQVVVYEGEILEKPGDAAEAQRFIRWTLGRTSPSLLPSDLVFTQAKRVAVMIGSILHLEC